MASKHIAVWPRVRVFPVDGKPVVVDKGDFLPEGVSIVELENLVSFGAIVGVAGTATDVSDDADDEVFDPAKGGDIKATEAYVGDDKVKAAAMLELEQAKGDKARKSLVEKLEAIVTEPSA